MDEDGNLAVLEPPRDGFSIEAEDVTGFQLHSVSLAAPGGPGLPLTAPASQIALALAARMRLPEDVSYALRDEATGTFLEESRPIGEQVKPGTRVTMTPKAHLGSNATL